MDKCIKKNQSISYNTTYVFYTVFIMFLCVCLSYCMFMLIQPLTHVNSSGTFESYFKEIKSEYSEQYDLSWKIVKSSVKSVLNHASPESPAVVLLLGMKENEDRINIITDKLARVIAISFNETLPEYKDFDLNNLASISDYVEVKHKIVETISTSVEWNKHHVLVIHHLEKIPAKGAMAFHSFCDHESAPYKNVVYLFRASISEMPLKEDIQLFDSIATKYLNQIWEKDLDQDKRGALISRLTSAVAMFK
ncbi:torsin-1A-interacting protein 2-like isoform X1 [Limulus polyphemus]|uniref:Torsin-1A-interacting protein 2-like isoform X1 n=1 Tax=Limulus polyphemus TaxID=6850 RepID=A0ABM1SKP0_LIMPO|nr:torsin-1A-interacting protein 2-like isoform X1 [Limulus polyphemus]XP_013776791.2 torsin-1A-interacting protein 2-like isoform X1 [Limulus polyphemus]XP_022244193.1 torsin-1A-interacting protein 2-like isoform X1 [Limulus polyphemus]XP_022244194.1 torsin-1A-interacting protein 2-like isoform X1 [Limulus polyphemus]XP_022244195.1 torsin-1A-interacting protein 2-like isoform X1 [Limulus polyphemus]XP_022244196.1 torsin-1A-interacting protein 2-like isoform X1 [Limulus polyphemus]